MAWKKGQSGNPRGPKPGAQSEIRDVRTLARKHTAEAVRVVASNLRHKDGKIRNEAARIMLDRGWGKPAQEITGPRGGPIQVSAAVAPDLSKLSDADFQLYCQLADKLTALPALPAGDPEPGSDQGGDQRGEGPPDP